MFCYQCEQTAKGTGCTVAGVCGKDGQTAALQDLLVYQAKQIGVGAHRARQLGIKDQHYAHHDAGAGFESNLGISSN